MVIGTWKRLQWSQAAPVATAPETAPMMPRSSACLVVRRLADDEDQRESRGGENPADEGQQQQDRGQGHPPLGGEEQRQAPGRRGDGERGERAWPVTVDRPGPVDWPIDWPIQPTANSRIALAMETKMSLKPVISRKCSSSTPGRARCVSTNPRSAAAESALIAPAATASSRSFWLYMDFNLPVRPRVAQVCYCVNTACRVETSRSKS